MGEEGAGEAVSALLRCLGASPARQCLPRRQSGVILPGVKLTLSG